MNADEIILFLRRANAAGATIDLCEAQGDRAIVRGFDGTELAEPEIAADAVIEACKSDAVGRTGKLRYELIGVREGKRWGRCALMIDAGQGAFGEEDASLKGILIECIRDKRDVMRMAFAHTEELFRRFDHQLEMAHKQLTAVEEQRIKIFEVLEDLTSHKHERDLANRKAEQEQANSAQMMSTIMPLIPAGMNKLLGAASGKANLLGVSSVNELVKSLDEEQIVQIGAILKAPQQAALFQILEAAEDEKAQQEARRNGTAPPVTMANAGAGDIIEVLENAAGGVG